MPDTGRTYNSAYSPKGHDSRGILLHMLPIPVTTQQSSAKLYRIIWGYSTRAQSLSHSGEVTQPHGAVTLPHVEYPQIIRYMQHVGAPLFPPSQGNEAKEKTKEKTKERRPVPRVEDLAPPISFDAGACSQSPRRPEVGCWVGGAEARRGGGNGGLHGLANYLASLFREHTFTRAACGHDHPCRMGLLKYVNYTHDEIRPGGGNNHGKILRYPRHQTTRHPRSFFFV